MQKVTLEQAKLHLRVDGAEEDGLITGLIAAAYGAIEVKIFRRVVEAAEPEPAPQPLSEPEPTTDPEPAPWAGEVTPQINAAALLLITHVYEHRGDTDEAMPQAVLWLLQPYVDYTKGA